MIPFKVSEIRKTTPGLASVVICCYNNWPDLEMTIESALCQSYSPVEVIVVDNSSTDATSTEVPRRFGERLRYIRQSFRRTVGAYNTGFQASRGEYIQFVDGDDVLAPNKIAKQVEVFQADPGLDIVYGDVRKFQSLAKVPDWEELATHPHTDMLKDVIILDGIGFCTMGLLFHRKALEKVGPYDETVHVGDYDYWLRSAYAGCRFGHSPGTVMGFYRQHPGQMTRDSVAIQRGVEEVWRKALGYVKEDTYRKLITRLLSESMFHRTVCRYDKTRTTQEALSHLAEVRATCPEFLSAPAYAIARAAIVVPGGTALFRSTLLRPIRQFFGSLLLRRTS